MLTNYRDATRADLSELLAILHRRSFTYDDGVRLSSGGASKYYYDGKLSMLDPETLQLVGEVLVDPILRSRAEAVGGLEIGSVPISLAVGQSALKRGLRLPSFIVRKDRKEHGKKELIAQAFSDGDELIRPGRRVAIVDDVITEGDSVRKAINAVKDAGCEVALVVVLVERHEGGADRLRAEGYRVLSVLTTDEAGNPSINEDFARLLEPVRAPAR